MILILSQDSFEYSTNAIIDYLDALGGNYLRINGTDILEPSSLNVNVTNNTAVLKGKKIDFDQIRIVFNRRWWDSSQYFSSRINNGNFDSRIVTHYISTVTDEFYEISEFIFHHVSNCLWIPKRKNVNKLIVLTTAQKVGLSVPRTSILSQKKDLLDLYHTFKGQLITKAISDFRNVDIEKDSYSYFTKKLSYAEIMALPESFFPSLFQEMIEKEYEIRVFYFLGDCYCIAIFSQADENTSVDFRHYNRYKPNRNIPYELPAEIKVKIVQLMDSLNLNTGSIDLIRSVTGEYIFLEVNPVGQFGMVAHPTNINLHKVVAQKLIEYDHIPKFSH